MKPRRIRKPTDSFPRWLGPLIIGSVVLGAALITYSYTRPFAARAAAASASRSNSKTAAARASAAVQARAKELIRYSDMVLAPEQQAIKAEVLGSIPAVCCKKFPLLTCCCPCNLSKTVWGLSNYLIVAERADAARLRTEVKDWLHLTNPAGYSGDACFHGGCKRPFAENGCGGMDQANVLF